VEIVDVAQHELSVSIKVSKETVASQQA